MGAVALKKIGAVAALQPRNLQRDRRLGNAEDFRRPRKAEATGDRIKGTELAVAHDVSISSIV